MSLESDVKAFLVANGQGTNLFMGLLPPDPDDAAALYQYAGLRPEFVQNKPGISRDRPALQVKCRSKVYATAQTRAMAIYALLAFVVNEELSGTTYQRIEPLGAPFFLERDKNQRTVFAANYYVSRTP